MPHWTQRTQLLMGEEKMQRLKAAHVLIVGTGGVGGYAAEMLCRAGIGELTLVDADDVDITNINRQLPALHSTQGKSKVHLLAQRFQDINPEIKLHEIQEYFTAETLPELLISQDFSFIIDAIDTIQPKCALIATALAHKIPIISSMGAGAKKDISQVLFSNLWKTYHCGLSRAVRKQLKRMGLKGKKIPVVFSTEAPDERCVLHVENERNKKTTAGTVSYMPAVFGCYLAEYVIKKI